MINAIKAEFRKILTARSTYFLICLALLLVIAFAFYAKGIKSTSLVADPSLLASEVVLSVSIVTLLIAFVGVLLVTHEYRYNTINYTLTLARSRSQVFLAKIITISLFAIVLSLFFGALAPVLTDLGIKAHGATLVPQIFPVWDSFWRAIFYGWAYSMMALMLALLIRVQVGAFISLFLIPSTIEPLLSLLLKKDTVYLPFTVLQSVADHSQIQFISYQRAALISAAYIVVGMLIAWQLFLRRDAN